MLSEWGTFEAESSAAQIPLFAVDLNNQRESPTTFSTLFHTVYFNR
jgi:hypothetical protein